MLDLPSYQPYTTISLTTFKWAGHLREVSFDGPMALDFYGDNYAEVADEAAAFLRNLI